MSNAPADPRDFTIIAHRGARDCAPENTLLAFDRAIALGADMIELDVQQHPEGALLVFHDPDLRRLNGQPERLAATPLARLCELDLGAGQSIPTLDEALELIDARVTVNVEIKTADGTGEAVAGALRRYLAAGWPAERLLVSSFHLPELWEFRQTVPEIPVAALLAGVPLDFAGCASELQARAVCIASEFADPRLIADAHTRGCKVFVYTVNDTEEMARLRAGAADGVFTDRLQAALAWRSGQQG